MPYPFTLPTTSSFSFSSSFTCNSHPSLTLNASIHRGVVRDSLKNYKKLSASSKASSLATVISSLESYIPYLLTVDTGLSNQGVVAGETVEVVLNTTPAFSWRPTLSDEAIPGREKSRVKVTSLEHEIAFVLSTLGFAHSLSARSALQPLYSTTTEFLNAEQRKAVLVTASKHLLEAASIYQYIAARSEQIVGNAPAVDVSISTLRALGYLAHAEATLLAVFKDDPYPAVVAQDRNKVDTEWMFKSPEISQVRAHLIARLCLAASEHAAKASALCHSVGSGGSNKPDSKFLRYLEDLRHTSRAKACRFFGINAEMGGDVAEGIAWLRAGLAEIGVEPEPTSRGLSFSRIKKSFMEKREDRRVDKETAWGADAGKLEEMRILDMLNEKWNRINDTMNTRPIPAIHIVLAKMPSGREMHVIKPYQVPSLDRNVLKAMQAPPEGSDDFGDAASSDDEVGGGPSAPIGAYPGSAGNSYY